MLSGQPTNLGIPSVINYAKKKINSGTQTWDVATDNKGFSYFANNSGLLVYDGYNWTNFSLPNNTVVRSVAIGKQGNIYVGGQSEFGYFSPKKNGQLVYTSLMSRLSDSTPFEDVWDIVVYGEDVFFRTDFQIFKFDGVNTVTNVYRKNTSLLFIGIWKGKLLIQDESKILYEYVGQGFVKRKMNDVFNSGRISAVIDYINDTVLIATIDQGIFYESTSGFLPWKTTHDAFLKKNIIYCGSVLFDGQLVLGTSFDGVVIMDKHRRIIQHLNKNHGMQNNTVLSAAITHDGNIWLGLDNGIDMIDLNDPLRHYFPDKTLEGTGYTSILYQNSLFFGTNTGLYNLPWKKYYTPEEKESGQIVPNTQGQVWSLNLSNNDLLVGHHSGAFMINQNKATRISDLLGIWKFIRLNDQLALAGYYKGLSVFEKRNNSWHFLYKIKGFDESARIISKVQSGNIWIAHPYRCVYKISETDLALGKVTPISYSSENPDKRKFRNMFFEIGSSIIMDDGNDLFKYNHFSNRTEVFDLLSYYLPKDDRLKFMVADDFKNVWYGTENETGFLMPDKTFQPSYTKFTINELTGLLPGGFESVYTIDEHNVVFPTEKGFLFFDPSKYINDTSRLVLLISKIILKSNQDSILFTIHKGGLPVIVLKSKENNLVVKLSVTATGNKDFVSYCYKFEGSSVWSSWSKDPTIAFNNLTSGNYTLQIKAKNGMGKESEVQTISIKIGFPWYRTWWAYVLYTIAIFYVLYLGYRKQKIKHEVEKSSIIEKSKKREEEHLINAEASKEEITRLQNEKLIAELNYKNQELTSFTYHLVNKNELISEIKEIINKVDHKLHDHPEIKKDLKNVIKLTEQNSDVDQDWENFIKSFDQVHTNFFKRLKEDFKDLSPNDYKMCTYLRMNLTTKEIASLMNISIRSVETNRYRLRKKLGLESDINLSQFLMNF